VNTVYRDTSLSFSIVLLKFILIMSSGSLLTTYISKMLIACSMVDILFIIF